MAIVSSVVAFIDSSPSVSTTIDITDVDIFEGSTPKAAILTFVQARGDDQASYTQNEASFNGGDGSDVVMGVSRMGGVFYGVGAMAIHNSTTRQWACGIAHEGHTTSDQADNGYNRSRSARRQSEEHCICIPHYYNDTPMAESTGSFIANGIRLTHNPSTWETGHDHGSGNLLLEVTLIGGSDFSAYCTSDHGSTGDNPSTTSRTIGGIPFRPNVGMFGNAFPESSSNPMDKGDRDIYLSHGWLSDDGAGNVDQFCRNMKNEDDLTRVDVLTRIEDDRFNQSTSGTGSADRYNRCYHTNFDTSGSDFEHNFTMSNPANTFSQFFGALYMKFDNDDYYLKSITLPTSTGSNTSLSPNGAGNSGGTAVQKMFGAADVTSYGTNYSGSGGTRWGNFFDWTLGGTAATSVNWNFITANQTESNPCFMEFSIDGFRSFGGRYVNSSSTFEDNYAYFANEVLWQDASLVDAAGFTATFTTVPAQAAKAFIAGIGTPKKTPTISIGPDEFVPYIGDKRVVQCGYGSKSQHKPRTLKTAWYHDPIQTSHGTWTVTSGDIKSISNVSGSGVKLIQGDNANFSSRAEHVIPCEPYKQYKLDVTLSADTRTSTANFVGLAQEITSGGPFKTAGYTQGTTGVWADGDRIPISEYYIGFAASGQDTYTKYFYSVGEEIIMDWFFFFQPEDRHFTVESVRLYEYF